MDFPIKFLLLQKSELMYEVAIRGETPSDNVEGLRRQINKLTQLYPPEDVCESVYDFAVDIKGSNDTLDKIRQNLDTLKTAPSNESLVNRTKSLLHHLYYRLLRLERPGNSEEKSLFDKVQESFQRNLNRIAVYDTRAKPAATTSGSVSNTAGSESLDTTAGGLNVKVTCDRGVTSELSKLKYNGETCVRAFIQKIVEFQIAKGLSDEKMLCSATELFTENALHWYRAIKPKVTEWKLLLDCLRDDFDVVDFDYRMSAEIRSRTQGESETVVVYFAIMEGMFNRLSQPMTDADKLEILLHNIRPCFSAIIAVSNIKSVEELKVACRNYERIKTRADDFKEPPVASSSTVAPEFAFCKRKEASSGKPKFNNNNFYRSRYTAGSTGNSFNNSKPVQPNYSNSAHRTASIAKIYCYRCKTDAHSMRECPAERTIFCFNCGEKDVRAPDCPKCSKAGKKN